MQGCNDAFQMEKRRGASYIAALQRFSLIDYPNRISAVVFTQGCNFRCKYCFNRELIPIKEGVLDEKDVLSFLSRRRSLLDAVVITGGEPLLHDIKPFISEVKKLGFLVAINTNGSFPERLHSIAEMLDFIAMDVKAPIHKYEELTGVKCGDEILRSIEIIMNSGKEYEFRVTAVRELSEEDIIEIAKMVEGAKRLVLQRAISAKNVRVHSYSDEELESLRKKIERFVEECIVR